MSGKAIAVGDISLFGKFIDNLCLGVAIRDKQDGLELSPPNIFKEYLDIDVILEVDGLVDGESQSLEDIL